jgi:hypothetical protein
MATINTATDSTMGLAMTRATTRNAWFAVIVSQPEC